MRARWIFIRVLFLWSTVLVSSLSAEPDPLYFFHDVYRSAVERLLNNISPPNAARGVVIAASPHHGPNYFKHWVRDAGIVMNVIITLYDWEQHPGRRAYYRQLIFDWLNFERANQMKWTGVHHLGEAFFYADGSVRNEEWGVPQMDGPALRSIAATRWAFIQLREGNEAYVRQFLYDGRIPTESLIKSDLEAISHGGDYGFDLWEEVMGFHFYTRRVQHKALLLGQKLAERLGDHAGAEFYGRQIAQRKQAIAEHWDWHWWDLRATLEKGRGVQSKHTGLDAAIILGMNHGDTFEIDGWFPIFDDRALMTAHRIEQQFLQLFPINHRHDLPGIAIGRYLGDPWDGYSRSGEGNPWFITTNAFGEFYARVAQGFFNQKFIQISPVNQDFFSSLLPSHRSFFSANPRIHQGEAVFGELIAALSEKSRNFARRSLIHGGVAGPFTEQFDRRNGGLRGVENLTWSCASLITMAHYQWSLAP